MCVYMYIGIRTNVNITNVGTTQIYSLSHVTQYDLHNIFKYKISIKLGFNRTLPAWLT